MAFSGLFDLLIAFALLVLLVGSFVLFLVPTRVGRGGRVWLLVASLAGTGLLILFNVAYFNGFGTDPVIGSPTAAQVTETWMGSGGVRCRKKPRVRRTSRDGKTRLTSLCADLS